MANILICDDDKEIVDAIEIYLKNEGYKVYKAYDGEEAIRILKAEDIQLLIMDVMMPKLDGIHATLKIREYSSIPIIMLSAKTEDTDKILGLNVGADDYVSKPFNPLELIARVKALFRRQEAMGQSIRLESGAIASHGLTIDPLSREVRLHGEAIVLTPREFDLLYWFARHPGEVFSRLSLLENVWGYQHEGYEHTVNTHINRLRIKIENDPAEPEIILTVWGKGYKFATDKPEPAP